MFLSVGLMPLLLMIITLLSAIHNPLLNKDAALLLGAGLREEAFGFSVGSLLLAHIFNFGDSDTCVFEVKERQFAITGDKKMISGPCKDRECGSFELI